MYYNMYNSSGDKFTENVTNPPQLIMIMMITGYPFPDGLPPPGVFNGFRPPLPGVVDPSRAAPPALPPGVIGGKP